MTSLLKVSGLLSLKEGWHRIKWNLQAKVQHPEKRASSWEEKLSSLLDGEWAFAKYQRGMTQDKVKFVCQGALPQKMGIFLRRKRLMQWLMSYYKLFHHAASLKVLSESSRNTFGSGKWGSCGPAAWCFADNWPFSHVLFREVLYSYILTMLLDLRNASFTHIVLWFTESGIHPCLSREVKKLRNVQTVSRCSFSMPMVRMLEQFLCGGSHNKTTGLLLDTLPVTGSVFSFSFKLLHSYILTISLSPTLTLSIIRHNHFSCSSLTMFPSAYRDSSNYLLWPTQWVINTPLFTHST